MYVPKNVFDDMKRIIIVVLLVFCFPAFSDAGDFLMQEYFDTLARRYVCYTREQLPQYEGTDVHHLISLPENYSEARKWPVIFELTGNRWGYGDGSVEEAHLGLSISLKRDFIVVVTPYVAEGGRTNQPKWWGDENLTVSYLKELVGYMDSHYSIDCDNLFLCGFSRGAIGVSYIGLYDDEIAPLWKGFISHDHFDGFREWKGTEWGTPLEKYRAGAVERLSRLDGRHWYVSYNGTDRKAYKANLKEMGADRFGKFHYAPVEIKKYFPVIPNAYFRSGHNDIWPAFDIEASRALRAWLYEIVDSK